MKRIRIIGLALVAVFAMTAIAAASASAEPQGEFGRCIATKGGKFLDSGCKKAATPGKEKFEWNPGVVNSNFTSKLKEGDPDAGNGRRDENHVQSRARGGPLRQQHERGRSHLDV